MARLIGRFFRGAALNGVLDRNGAFTGRQIVLWSLALIPVSLFPSVVGMTGRGYFMAAALLGVAFLACAVKCALTGSRPDGTAFPAGDDLTCGNWTSSGAGRAQVGHHDRKGREAGVNSWNSVHPSRGCSPGDLEATGGAGLFYCFAID